MILKVADALISFSRTDPECIARRDPGVIFPAACCELYKISLTDVYLGSSAPRLLILLCIIPV